MPSEPAPPALLLSRLALGPGDEALTHVGIKAHFIGMGMMAEVLVLPPAIADSVQQVGRD